MKNLLKKGKESLKKLTQTNKTQTSETTFLVEDKITTSYTVVLTETEKEHQKNVLKEVEKNNFDKKTKEMEERLAQQQSNVIFQHNQLNCLATSLLANGEWSDKTTSEEIDKNKLAQESEDDKSLGLSGNENSTDSEDEISTEIPTNVPLNPSQEEDIDTQTYYTQPNNNSFWSKPEKETKTESQNKCCCNIL